MANQGFFVLQTWLVLTTVSYGHMAFKKPIFLNMEILDYYIYVHMATLGILFYTLGKFLKFVSYDYMAI